ncbi:MAG: BACON domain-containing carbohydrate-binding protein [Bacteroidales bacterium]|nr:BACON domain-containing carbohydrate-binding protein [Bacteroidales bacterium]
MNYKFLFTAFVALMSMVLVGCSDDDATYLSEIRVSQSYVAIDKAGGEVAIDITASDSWSIDAAKLPEWLEVSPLSGEAGSGKITFKAAAYEGGREAELVINCAGKAQHVNVIQGLKSVENATCAQVIAGPDSKTYRVTGTCTGIYNTTYGNWYLTDETGTITIYGTLDKNGQEKNFTSLGIEVGDIVTVEGPKTTYGTTIELVNVTVVKIVKSLIKVVETDPADATAPLEGGEVTFNLECKGNGVNVEIPAEAKDWLSIVSVTSGATPTVVFKAAPNTGGDRNAEITFKTYDDKGAEYTAVATLYQKGAIVAATVAEFKAAPVGDTQYRMTGVVTALDSKGNPYIRDYSDMEAVLVYKPTGFTGKVGDIITVVGKRAEYKEVAQVGNGVVEEIKAVTEVTIDEFLTKADDANVYYMVTGTIDEIANATYGNLYLKSADTRLYVYGTYPGYGATGDARKNVIATLGLEVGDKLTVIGTKTTYKDTPQVNGGIYFSHEKAEK